MWKALESLLMLTILMNHSFLTSKALVLYFDGSYRPPPPPTPSTPSSLLPLFLNTKLLSSSSIENNDKLELLPSSSSLSSLVSYSAVLILNKDEAKKILTTNKKYDNNSSNRVHDNIYFVGGQCISLLSMQEEEFLLEGGVGGISKVTSAHSEYKGLLLGLQKLKLLLDNSKISSSSSRTTSTCKKQRNRISLVIKGDCKTIIQQINKTSNPRKLLKPYNNVLHILNELKCKYNLELEGIELLPRQKNVLCDSVCHLSTYTVQRYIIRHVNTILNQINNNNENNNNNNNNRKYLNHIWNKILCDKTNLSYLKLSSCYIDYLLILYKLYQKCIECNHYLILEYIGMTYCIESITLSTSSVMALESIFYPSSTTDTSINTTTTATTTTTTTNEIDINTTTIATNKTSNSIDNSNDIVNNNIMSWKEYLLIKGIQIQSLSLQKQLAISKSSKSKSSISNTKKRIKNIKKIQKSYKYRAIMNKLYNDSDNNFNNSIISNNSIDILCYDDFLSNHDNDNTAHLKDKIIYHSNNVDNIDDEMIINDNDTATTSTTTATINNNILLKNWDLLSMSLCNKCNPSVNTINYTVATTTAKSSSSLSILQNHPLFQKEGVWLQETTKN